MVLQVVRRAPVLLGTCASSPRLPSSTGGRAFLAAPQILCIHVCRIEQLHYSGNRCNGISRSKHLLPCSYSTANHGGDRIIMYPCCCCCCCNRRHVIIWHQLTLPHSAETCIHNLSPMSKQTEPPGARQTRPASLRYSSALVPDTISMADGVYTLLQRTCIVVSVLNCAQLLGCVQLRAVWP